MAIRVANFIIWAIALILGIIRIFIEEDKDIRISKGTYIGMLAIIVLYGIEVLIL